ncbi:hypothetical protein M5E88_11225 [Akkermansia muciniphila]|nr:hypothetical protein M5E88_11225 [Akkermansia muciniphila]
MPGPNNRCQLGGVRTGLPATFLRLGGSDSGPMHCTLTAPSTQMEVILCPIPGVADNLIILPLGYGGINHVAERQEKFRRI